MGCARLSKCINLQLQFNQSEAFSCQKFCQKNFQAIWLACDRLNESDSFSVFSIKKSKDLIGWFLLWREKKLSRNLGDVKDEEISIEFFEGWMVKCMLGTKIILIGYDVKMYAKQNDFHSSSNFQNSTFQYPDHEEFCCFILTGIVLFWFNAESLSLRPRRRRANEIAWNFFWQNFWQKKASGWLKRNSFSNVIVAFTQSSQPTENAQSQVCFGRPSILRPVVFWSRRNK